MKILLEVTSDAAGRLTGTAGCLTGTDDVVERPAPFDGALELLALIDDLSRPDPLPEEHS